MKMLMYQNLVRGSAYSFKNAAINRRDVFIRYGAYPGIEVPSILGSDGAGIVAEIGEGVEEFPRVMKW